jgi:hypothetical protein
MYALIEISHGIKNFLSLLKALLEDYSKLSIIS